MQIRDPDFQFIRQLVYDQSGIHLGEEKKGEGDWSGHYRVKQPLREQIDFQHINLLDGAASMKLLHDLPAHTIAQDASTSAVYGMARKAVKIKALDSIVSLENIASKIVKALEKYNRQIPPPTPYAK